MASTLSEQIKKYRKAKGMTQEQLSQASGLSVSTVRQIEQKGGDPTISTVQAIANALCVDIALLLAKR